jgi:hypothetical protein
MSRGNTCIERIMLVSVSVSNPDVGGEGASFSTLYLTGPGGQPASCTGPFPGVKRPGRGVKYPSHLV